MARSVENSMDVQRIADDGEENPVRKTIGEHTSNVSIAMNNAK